MGRATVVDPLTGSTILTEDFTLEIVDGRLTRLEREIRLAGSSLH